MATPHVAGAVALLQQYSKLKNNRALKPDEIGHLLKFNGVKIADTGGTGLDYTRIDILSALEAKGDVSTTIGATPFYTTSENPHNESCLAHLNDGESCNQTWIVNATGEHGSQWEFFVIYETDYSYNITLRLNVTILDKTPPSINVVNPSPVERDSQTNLTISITDLQPDTYQVYKNGSLVLNGTYSNGAQFNVSIDTSQLTLWNYTIWANDTVGNINSTSVSITVQDTTPPSITITSPQNRSYPTNSTWFKANITDAASEVDSVFVEYDGINHTLINGSGNSWLHFNTSMPEMIYTAVFWANDSLGNAKTSTVYFSIDKTPPFITITYPRNNTNFNIFHKLVNVTGFATDHIIVTYL